MAVRERAEKYADRQELRDDGDKYGHTHMERSVAICAFDAGFKEAVAQAAEVVEFQKSLDLMFIDRDFWQHTEDKIRALADDAQKTPQGVDNSTPTPKGSGT